MKTRVKHYLKYLWTDLLGKFCYVIVMASAFLVPTSFIQPVSAAERPDAAILTVSLNTSGQITAVVTAVQPIKVGMLVYRLVTENDDADYLVPIILSNFTKGDVQEMEPYTVPSGNWTKVEAYLCIGKCEWHGDNPPKNAAAFATTDFNTASPVPLLFPQ